MEDLTPPNDPHPITLSKRQLGNRYVQIWVDKTLLSQSLEVENLLHSEGPEIGTLMMRVLELVQVNRRRANAARNPAEERYYKGKAQGFTEAMKVIHRWKEETL